jgi:transcriptional regulator with XRE-family HTH domain
MENLRKSKLRNSESILGDFFFMKRVQKKLKLQEVAKMVKGTTRQLKRIESGESLPGCNSYYIQKLLEIYDVTQEEREKVMWFIVIMKDMIEVTSENKNVLQKPGSAHRIRGNNSNNNS